MVFVIGSGRCSLNEEELMTEPSWLTVAIVVGWLVIVAATAIVLILHPIPFIPGMWMIPI